MTNSFLRTTLENYRGDHQTSQPASWDMYVKDWVRPHVLPGAYEMDVQKSKAESHQNLPPRSKCNQVKFSGTDAALYERHLMFDQVVPVAKATSRDKLEALARSVRDVLAERWLQTEQTYQERNVKRVHYLSLEFLMGRALANNLTNLMLDRSWGELCEECKIDPLEIMEEEPDAGLGNGGLGRLAACFLDSMATLGIPGMGCGLRYEYGIFKGGMVAQSYFEHRSLRAVLQ